MHDARFLCAVAQAADWRTTPWRSSDLSSGATSRHDELTGNGGARVGWGAALRRQYVSRALLVVSRVGPQSLMMTEIMV